MNSAWRDLKIVPGTKRADLVRAANGVAKGERSELHTSQEPVKFAICDKVIVEASNGVPGDDALQCEGSCLLRLDASLVCWRFSVTLRFSLGE